jgi:hypothetical protein
MKSIVFRASGTLLALGIAALGLAGTASASHVVVDLTIPDQVAIGQPTQVAAHFHSDSDRSPIAGMTVMFHEEVTFGGVTSDVELGGAVTDENGVAALAYQPRTAGTHEIHVRYAYNDGEEEDAAASLTVPATGQQLYRSTAGVKIPGLNVWLLMALVAVVWAILLSVAFRVIAIAHDDELPPLGRAGSIGSK